jgi:hypothetical protein
LKQQKLSIMYVNNTRPTRWYVIYKTLGGTTKRQLVSPGEQVEIAEIESVSQILFDPYTRRRRSINDRLARGLSEGIECRLTPGLTGSTL